MAVALSPNATRLYVSNASSNTLTVIDTSTFVVVATRPLSPEKRSDGPAILHDVRRKCPVALQADGQFDAVPSGSPEASSWKTSRRTRRA
jgi:YVTN family beta-propeller protein